MDDKEFLKRLKEVNKFKTKEEYSKNAFVKIGPNLSFISDNLDEIPFQPISKENLLEIHCNYESTYYEEWKIFVPIKRTEHCNSFYILRCQDVVKYIQKNIYPFNKHFVVFIYDTENYFKQETKNFTKVMNNKQVDWNKIISRQQLDSWMLSGLLSGYKILLTQKDKLPLTIRQYCKLAAHKPYREIMEKGASVSRCGDSPQEIWYRMIESIPRIRKNDIGKFMIEFPNIKSFIEKVDRFERSFPQQGYKTIKSVGSAIAMKIYKIIYGLD
eukprot:NODE_9_length_64580_cov_1.431941.p32 type:complete len:271 gc:universal NODE_9_length_64580_cov_1.431941:28039-28851(+)